MESQDDSAQGRHLLNDPLQGQDKDVFSVPTKSQRLIFDLVDIKYEWRGKLVNDDGEVLSVDEDYDA